MSDITTKAGREGLRRHLKTCDASGTTPSPLFADLNHLDNLFAALDGLDIADRIVWPIRVLYWLTCHEEAFPGHLGIVWLRHHRAAQAALEQAIAKWDNWLDIYTAPPHHRRSR